MKNKNKRIIKPLSSTFVKVNLYNSQYKKFIIINKIK